MLITFSRSIPLWALHFSSFGTVEAHRRVTATSIDLISPGDMENTEIFPRLSIIEIAPTTSGSPIVLLRNRRFINVDIETERRVFIWHSRTRRNDGGSSRASSSSSSWSSSSLSRGADGPGAASNTARKIKSLRRLQSITSPRSALVLSISPRLADPRNSIGCRVGTKLSISARAAAREHSLVSEKRDRSCANIGGRTLDPKLSNDSTVTIVSRGSRSPDIASLFCPKRSGKHICKIARSSWLLGSLRKNWERYSCDFPQSSGSSMNAVEREWTIINGEYTDRTRARGGSGRICSVETPWSRGREESRMISRN